MSSKIFNNAARVTKIFQPLIIPQKDAQVKVNVSKSYEHMIEAGMIRRTSIGMYALLPMGLRVLEKLTDIVDQELMKIDAQKMLLPALTPKKLWEKSGRLEQAGRELFTLRDKHDCGYILSPTHEETITDLISKLGPLSAKTLPLRLYQISSKWRDELKPRQGFIRSREFIMKDLYTFDTGPEKALETYEIVNQAYDNILKQIGVRFIKAIGSTGMIGGSLSHEYHYFTDIGEDIVFSCSQCNYHINKNATDESTCPTCKSSLVKNNTLEIGHSFLLGTKYSAPLDAVYHGTPRYIPLSMGCYGLGLTRLISAAAEILSTDLELRWPHSLAPYTVCIIPPKVGSKPETATVHLEKICDILSQSNIDYIIDDRTDLTIGNRFVYTRKCGYPFVIIIGKLAVNSPPLFELYDVNNSTRNDVSMDALYSYFNEKNVDKKIQKEAIVC